MANFFFKDGKLPLNADASRYVKYGCSTKYGCATKRIIPALPWGDNVPNTCDISIRCFRTRSYGQLTDRVFTYLRIGINNLRYNADRESGGTPGASHSSTGGFFLHDAAAEHAIVKNKLSFGAGSGAWNGLARYASSSADTIMSLDLPTLEESTNDMTDQFGRKLSVYLKGKLGKLDYHLATPNPLLYQKAASYVTTPSPNASALTPPKLQGPFLVPV